MSKNKEQILEEFEKDRVCSHCGGVQKRIKSFDIEWVCENKKCGQCYIISFSKALTKTRRATIEEIEKAERMGMKKMAVRRLGGIEYYLKHAVLTKREVSLLLIIKEDLQIELSELEDQDKIAKQEEDELKKEGD